MFMAIKSNQIDSIRFLLGKQLPVWLKGQAHLRDNSPVFYAIRQRNIAALELFADRNTEEMNHAVDSHGSNVIMYAASVGNFEAVNYLSVRGVKLDVEDREQTDLKGSRYQLLKFRGVNCSFNVIESKETTIGKVLTDQWG
jgi:hypothetical protein